MPAGTLNINPDTQGIKFTVRTHTLNSWKGSELNTIGSIVERLTSQAVVWFKQAMEALAFPGIVVPARSGFFGKLVPVWTGAHAMVPACSEAHAMVTLIRVYVPILMIDVVLLFGWVLWLLQAWEANLLCHC